MVSQPGGNLVDGLTGVGLSEVDCNMTLSSLEMLPYLITVVSCNQDYSIFVTLVCVCVCVCVSDIVRVSIYLYLLVFSLFQACIYLYLLSLFRVCTCI